MRRAVCFVLYVVMLVAGIGLAAGFLLHGGRGIVFAAGSFLAAFGAYLLWTDFVGPAKLR
jgi:hypothetical protein